MIRNKSKPFQPKNAKKNEKSQNEPFEEIFYEVADLQLYQKETPHTNNNLIKNDFGVSPFLRILQNVLNSFFQKRL